MAEYIDKWSVVDRLIELENEFQQYKPFHGFEHAMYRKICEAEIAIGKTPAADVVEVKRGRWIVDDCDSGEPNGYSAFIEFHCPFCNEPYTLESGEYNWYYGEDIPLKFCHECGADMREANDAN